MVPILNFILGEILLFYVHNYHWNNNPLNKKQLNAHVKSDFKINAGKIFHL